MVRNKVPYYQEMVFDECWGKPHNVSDERHGLQKKDGDGRGEPRM